jgi:3-oxoacyl-[acyl-carrier-protein] synthase-3
LNPASLGLTAMPLRYRNVYLAGAGLFMPGPPVGNDAIDRYIAPINNRSERIKRRVLDGNGILTRHYAIDENGATLHSSWDLAARAVRDCLASAGVALEDVTLLCTGSSGGDTGMPGFASMLHGELGGQPMETSGHHGVCAAGVSAMKHAANAVELGAHRAALVATSEFPSRMFKRSRFAPQGYNTDFDAHFLRWMLSDGAGAALLADAPRGAGASLQLEWIHTRSFAGDFPVCMQIGYPHGQRYKSYLDYPSLAEAERDGAFLLRQDVRLLPQLFDVGIHEYANLIRAGYFEPGEVDHLLCHYSSEQFAGVIEDMMKRAGLHVPRERWYSNLSRRGNTGAASIFIMLADFLRERELREGQRILCFVPESGRFTVSFMMLRVVQGGSAAGAAREEIPPPQVAAPGQAPKLAATLRELAGVWHDFRSRAWRTPLVRRVLEERFTREDYLAWMSCWIPQVREGSLWMREAVRNISAPYEKLRGIITAHADDEQFDFKLLFDDYKLAGGAAPGVDSLARNPGGEALNSFMHATAARPNPVGLLGGIYIIEGTGQRIIPALLPRLRRQLRVPEPALRFLKYHGQNDVRHLARWLDAVEHVLAQDPDGSAGRRIVETARAVADLYLLQMEHVL